MPDENTRTSEPFGLSAAESLLAGLAPAPKKQVTIRGTVLFVRSLSAAEARAADDSVLEPKVPEDAWIKDPNRGSLAPKIIDERHEGWRRAVRDHEVACFRARVAVASGLCGHWGDTSKPPPAEVIRTCVADMERLLTEPEIGLLARAYADLSRVDVDDAEKN